MIHVSAKHKMLGVPMRPDLKNLFPNAQVVKVDGIEQMVLPHIIDVAHVLRNMGLPAPAPVLSQYAWPHPAGKPPFEVQKRTVALMTMHPRAYVLNGMGTGKTKAALWAFDYLKQEGLAEKMLVVAPLSTLEFVWAREAFEAVPHLRIAVLHGTREKRLKRLSEPADIYIINHDGLKVMLGELEKRPDINTLVIDEIATFRNGFTRRSKLMRDYAGRMTWAWGMTGSPTPNEPTDVYGQVRILTPHRVPKFFTRFREQLMVRVNQFKWAPRPEATAMAHEAMQPAVRYTLDDVTELPDVVERVIDVPLGPQQKKIYEVMEKHSYLMMQQGEINAVNAGALMVKLLQISCGWVYDSKKNVIALDNEPRLERLVDDIEACAEKVLVFVPFVHTLDGIVTHLGKHKIECAAVSGDTPAGERAKIFNLFQNTNKIKVIVAHPQCMSHGLTLTAATLIIWFGPNASLETFDQANARIRRVGQKHKQLILMYAGTKIERRVYSILRRKQNIQSSILSLFEEETE